VGIVGLEHETNTFRPGTTPLSAFTVVRGDELLADRGKRTYLAGMLDGLDAIGADPVPLVVATAQPSGTIAEAAYAPLRDEIVAAVRAAGPLDALAVQLHGAGVVEGVWDLEADLGAALRAVVGDVPIVGSLDLHANLTADTLAPYDALSCVRLYPHVDMYDRGRECVEWLPRRWAGDRFDVHVQRLPWLLLPTATEVDGAAEAIRLTVEAERRPGVLDVTFVHGFPLADGPQVGCSVLVTTAAGGGTVARELAVEVAGAIWELRGRFEVPMHAPRDAVALALDAHAARADGAGPVVVAETSDNPGGGGVGDGTHLLRELIAADAPAVLGTIVDPEVALAAHRAGVGATLEVQLGGRLDASSGGPIAARATVLALSDGRYRVRGVGWDVDQGPAALLRIGAVDVVVVSANAQVFDDGPFTIHGVDVRTAAIVAVKSANHFRAYFGRFASAIVPVLGPGLSHQSTSLPWQHVVRPVWPLDPDVEPGFDR
jgi:microcystin degradation protein MlrC